jgi:hypothetical protein
MRSIRNVLADFFRFAQLLIDQQLLGWVEPAFYAPLELAKLFDETSVKMRDRIIS